MSGTILIIDDEADVLAFVKQLLVVNGYSVDTADNGSGGYAKAAENPPDLILLDMMMPGQSGLEVLKRLKAKPATCDVPVIALSALGEETFVDSALELGIHQYLTKPFESDDLISAVGEVLNAKA